MRSLRPGAAVWTSDQFFGLETEMNAAPDDDVIVQRNAERLGRDLDHPCHVDVRPRRLRVAGRVIVHQNQRGR